MRIAQVATLATPVRRESSGSVEGLVWLLSRELTRLGHDVTVFAAGDSEPCGELVASLPGPYATRGSPSDWQACEWINLCRAVEQSGRFDVLHCHAYLWGIPLQALSRAPLVHTLHISPNKDSGFLWSLGQNVCVTAISQFQWSAYPALRPAAVIHHGLDSEQFTFEARPADHVCYLGRFTSGKGAVQAIAAARALGLRLVLAGPPSAYFEEHVTPLVDGRSVEYVGYVSSRRRDELLRNARALLYPLQAPEPFGLVMIEAMMCGTPVAAIRVGAVPEIVDEGLTGCCATSAADFPHAVVKALALDRRRVRGQAEKRFTAERMAQEYVQVYQQAVLAYERAGHGSASG
jgi:glycosyltransferase involved in cell wall biosynthesis